MDNSLITQVLSGGLIAAVVGGATALVKLPKERQQAAIDISETAVELQQKVTAGIYAELERIKKAHFDCEAAREEDRKQHESDKKMFFEEIDKLRQLVKTIDERQKARRAGDELPPLEIVP